MAGRISTALLLPALLAGTGAGARTTLGTFDNWAAFRDDEAPRCFAIAEPERRSARWHPYATVSNWPRARVRSQFYARLSRELKAGAPVLLTIGNERIRLLAGRADAWAPDARTDARIIAAMRSAPLMRVSGVTASGRRFSDIYLLKGAATAIDAAALGCARG